jgi:two-component system response regulator HydG
MRPRSEGGPRGRVLVVDDQEDLCWVLAKILSERGHQVQTAGTGASALSAVRSGVDYQVAIVDYRLPDASGIELALELTSRLPRLLSILMSSYGSDSLRERAMSEGLFAYLDKPFDNDLMIRTVEDAIRVAAVGQ